MSVHPLAAMLASAAHNRFPAFDGMVEVLPSPGPPVDALVAFAGHFEPMPHDAKCSLPEVPGILTSVSGYA